VRPFLADVYIEVHAGRISLMAMIVPSPAVVMITMIIVRLHAAGKGQR
jgi:hypothetical protein